MRIPNTFSPFGFLAGFPDKFIIGFLFCLLIHAGAAQGAVIYVNAGATGSATGQSWANAFTDLQNALAIARPGDEIWIAQGVYTPTAGTDQSISFAMPAGTAIYGGFAGTESARAQRNWQTQATILSGNLGAQGSETVRSSYIISGGAQTILDGLTVSGGFYGMVNDAVSPAIANCAFSGNSEGGISNTDASPTVTNCLFTGNTAFSGGGMENIDSSPDVTSCTFTSNTALVGGGMDNEGGAPVVTGCAFDANSGGGMSNTNSSPTVTNCVFSCNNGSGMFNDDDFSMTVTGCVFSGNTASDGAGMYNEGGAPAVTNCVFAGNTADINGGGIYNVGGASAVTNCTFIGNLAGMGGAMSNSGTSLTLMNCILWNDSAPQGAEMANDTPVNGYPAVNHCDIQGSGGSASWNASFGHDGGGNIDQDPQFVDPALPAGMDNAWRTSDDGLALKFNSPCIHAGNPAGAPPLDILGNPRQGQPDIGAYQYIPHKNSVTGWEKYY